MLRVLVTTIHTANTHQRQHSVDTQCSSRNLSSSDNQEPSSSDHQEPSSAGTFFIPSITFYCIIAIILPGQNSTEVSRFGHIVYLDVSCMYCKLLIWWINSLMCYVLSLCRHWAANEPVILWTGLLTNPVIQNIINISTQFLMSILWSLFLKIPRVDFATFIDKENNRA